MGYSTDFEGAFELDKPLTAEHLAKLMEFVEARHEDSSMPGYYCQWIPKSDGTVIEWDGEEKFSNYTEWIQYLITHFLAPWGYVVNGEVEWSGEESGDLGKIVVTNNVVTEKKGKVSYD